MKKFKIAAIAGVALCAATSYASITSLGLSGLGTIQFNGADTTGSPNLAGQVGAFQFNSGLFGANFYVSTENSSPSGTAIGLLGTITPAGASAFAYGAITTSGGTQTANVLGPLGNLAISDGSLNLVGIINWMTVQTVSGGSGGQVNAALTVNVSGLAYSGPNADLLSFVNAAPLGNGSIDLSFAWNPSETLTQLSTGTKPIATGFSGVLAVPEPTTMVAGALLLLPFGWSTLRMSRKQAA